MNAAQSSGSIPRSRIRVPVQNDVIHHWIKGSIGSPARTMPKRALPSATEKASTPFLGIESSRDEPVPRDDRQIGLPNPERDLLTIELTELKNEVFGDGGSVQGESIQIHRRIGTVRCLAEDRYEQAEVLRFQQPIRIVNNARDPPYP
ncbi:hypothetical protein [Streptomyces umbrinus]|uniref:hypothetical protein n=1 Tax=Streptomyces umbrinus TaxID=67370 RepID=UPI003409676F